MAELDDSTVFGPPDPATLKASALTIPSDAAASATRVARAPVIPNPAPAAAPAPAPVGYGDNYGGGRGPDALTNKALKVTGAATEEGPNWMDKHRNLVIPILSGLAGMASSDSRYLGSAILQGLGTGAQAYSKERADELAQQQEALGLGKTAAGIGQTQQAIEESKSRTAAQRQENLKNSIMQTKAGVGYWATSPDGSQRKFFRLGQEDQIPVGWSLIDPQSLEGRQLNTGDPNAAIAGAVAPPVAADPGALPPPIATAQVTAAHPAGGPSIVPPEPVKQPKYMTQPDKYDAWNDDIASAAKADVPGNVPEANVEDGKNYFKQTNANYDAATSAIPNIRRAAIQSMDFIKSGHGGFAGAEIGELSKIYQGFRSSLGLPAEETTAGSQTDILNKQRAFISAQMSQGRGQEVQQALMAGLANTNMSPQAHAELAAELAVANLRMREEGRTLQLYQGASSSPTTLSYGNARAAFQKARPPEYYDRLIEGASKFFMEHPDDAKTLFAHQLNDGRELNRDAAAKALEHESRKGKYPKNLVTLFY